MQCILSAAEYPDANVIYDCLKASVHRNRVCLPAIAAADKVIFLESGNLRVFVEFLSRDEAFHVDELICATDQAEIDHVSDPYERAKRVRFKNRRRRILSSVLDCAPDKLNFSYTNGKPSLTEFDGFHFSTSYSGSAMALACANSPVGVDLEEISNDSANENVVETLFHHSEIDQLAGKSGMDWTRTFLAIWTQKEAFAKALGSGFGIEFSDFAVAPLGGTINCDEMNTENRPWYSKPLVVQNRHALAIASNFPVPEIVIEEFSNLEGRNN